MSNGYINARMVNLRMLKGNYLREFQGLTAPIFYFFILRKKK